MMLQLAGKGWALSGRLDVLRDRFAIVLRMEIHQLIIASETTPNF
jgi:hypothetical protein